MIVESIAKLMNGEHLNREEAGQTFRQIMEGKATDAQIGAYLVAQRLLGETLPEITGAAEVMREKATPIPHSAKNVVDTCGTGGDNSGTFNISTASALVTAGAGVTVAKHGNRSVSSLCGSADVLKTLGVNVKLSPDQVAQCIDEVGIGFLFAPLLHGAMKYVMGPRKEIAQRSIFNILGPLTNPAGAKRQIMGVFDAQMTETLANVLGALGAEHVWVVAGNDGLDEISVCAPTMVSEFKNAKVKSFELHPGEYGFDIAEISSLLGKDAKANANIILKILDGYHSPGRDIVLLNAGAAILVSGKANTFEDGIQLAREAIDSGKAKEKLDLLIHTSKELG